LLCSPIKFLIRRISQLEMLETHLKTVLKATENVSKVRKEKAACFRDFGASFEQLGTSEFNKPLSSCLHQLGETQQKIFDSLNEQVCRPFSVPLCTIFPVLSQIPSSPLSPFIRLGQMRRTFIS